LKQGDEGDDDPEEEVVMEAAIAEEAEE